MEKKNERVVELVGNTKSLLCNIKDLEKELVEKEEQIKKMNWNYQNLEYDMQQKCQLESCMKELLEQQREMQNELNIQLQKKGFRSCTTKNVEFEISFIFYSCLYKIM
ncbi:hypothetical protein ACMSFF_28145 [Bacteroides faecis]